MNTTAEAVKPVAPYVGGKILLAKTIISRIEAIPHTCSALASCFALPMTSLSSYAEPFIGTGFCCCKIGIPYIPVHNGRDILKTT